jgi:AcrR family transcriptional regulator
MVTNKQKYSTEIRREQIVQSALKIVADQSVRNLTTAAIANDLNMSEANIYRHFRSKDEILIEAVAKIGSGLKVNIEKVLNSDVKANPVGKLRKIFQLHIAFVENNAGIPRLVFSEEIHGGKTELREKLLQSIDSYACQLELLLKEGRKDGLLKKDLNTKSTALTFIGMVQITLLRWSLSGFSFSLSAEGKKIWNNFEKCISR